MANSGRSGSSRKTKSTSKKTTRSSASRSSSSRGNSRKNVQVQEESGFAGVIKKFASSKAASPIIFIAAVLLIVGIDLLVSWNKYELFFKILGIEVLIAVVVWIILTLVFSRKTNSDSEDEYEDEV
ncbi:MAG: hypothetical protein IKT10_01860 [Clostridiales bacterium]|nr:hypothetical protein [Clostridiales bacterium]